jgi:predicted NAD/FAD-binding protein
LPKLLRNSIANFINFLKAAKIETVPTEMSFSISRDAGQFEWGGSNVASLLCQPRNLLRPSFWRMCFDFMRFNLYATDLLREEHCDENPITIGRYLEQHRYSKEFQQDYLLPLTACVWSTGADKCALDFPAVTLIRFLMNHQLLNITKARPTWMTIPGGSKTYVDQIASLLPDQCQHRNTKVVSVETQDPSLGGRLVLSTESGAKHSFDDVVLACHGDQALEVLGHEATSKETAILKQFQTTQNVAYLHSDTKACERWTACMGSDS